MDFEGDQTFSVKLENLIETPFPLKRAGCQRGSHHRDPQLSLPMGLQASAWGLLTDLHYSGMSLSLAVHNLRSRAWEQGVQEKAGPHCSRKVYKSAGPCHL